MEPIFFETPADFRAWLEEHHADRSELLVGFHKKGTGRPSLTWPESVDQALCFGWIDGVRRGVDAISFSVRFTPRRKGSIWSRVNIRHVERLIAAGRMTRPGLEAYEARDEKKTGVYSFENRPKKLAPAIVKRFKANAGAWAWFSSQPPYYRRVATWYVMEAKRPETRERRLAALIDFSSRGRRIGPLDRPKAGKTV